MLPPNRPAMDREPDAPTPGMERREETTEPGGAPGTPPGAGQQPQQRLTPQEVAVLDRAFTPEVLAILIKAMPELEPVLRPFIEQQMRMHGQAGPGAAPAPAPAPAAGGGMPRPTSGLGNVRLG